MRQLRAILLLPGTVTVVIPATILYLTGISQPRSVILGSLFILLGLGLMVATVRLFITVGRGTLAPWNPPERLVVCGVYRHVRNPMITGVWCILLGEAILFGSPWLHGWFCIFVAVNMLVIPLVEEPGLVKRFGDDYVQYKQNVPRWIPRLAPWKGLSE
jgi:protein-S-isoprenylcysteine O-methyltransferase Ste14